MNSHTHRGHCQMCLRVQAIDMQTGLIAKHGYNVAHGYFSGTCPGSHAPSLHIERVLTNLLIKRCESDAVDHALAMADYKLGNRKPSEARSGLWITVTKVVSKTGRTKSSQEPEMVPFATAPAHFQDQAVQKEIWFHESHMRAAQDHAKRLTLWADKITGKVEAYRVEELDVGAWKQNDVVRIGGKKGFETVIEAIEDRPYTTRGFRVGQQTITCPHARITRPARPERRSRTGIIEQEARDAKTYWEPLRHIKRPKSALIQQLKKAGLL